ncbi:MAG: type II secretion system protein GspC [Gammaproteobacteria bacterium]
MPDNSFASLGASLQRALPASTRTRLLKWAPWILFVGLLVLAAWLAALLTWQFIPSASDSGQVAAHANVPVMQRTSGPAPAEQIVAAHLFGTAAAPTGQAGGENAPETSLDLNLIGVAAASGGTASQAIIASGTTHEETTYPVGATLPGGAIIHEILPDRVILAHAGRLETLRLPVTGTSILAAGMDFGTGNDAGGVPPGFENSLNLLTQHPQTVAQFLHFAPYVKRGHIEGYEVYPGSNPELFNQSGLQSGDVVISVNGAKLDNPGRSMQAMEQLRAARGPVHLVVLRRGQPMNITINPGG